MKDMTMMVNMDEDGDHHHGIVNGCEKGGYTVNVIEEKHNNSWIFGSFITQLLHLDDDEDV